jgi:hypothetical protein
MKMLIDLNEKRNEKHNILTPKKHLEIFLENTDEMDFAITIARCKDGEVKTGWSEANLLTILGALEAAKQSVLSEMWEEK